LQTISEAIVVATVVAGVGASAVIDLYTRRVPNPLTIGIAAVGVTMAATRVSGVSVAGAFAGFALGLLLMLPGHLIGATGAGDVKLFAAVGTLLGPSRIGMAFLYTAMAGGALSMVIALQRGRFGATIERTAALVYTGGTNVAEIERPSADNRFAYAPAIAVGAIVAALGV
jgi:prepilin peptidase CpaA